MVRAISAAAVLLLACGCGADADHWPEGRPKIDELRFAQQSPQDPFALEFLLLFSDTDGNTGNGMLHLSLGDEETSVLPMQELFRTQSPALELSATSGELELVVRVSTAVEVGDELRFGFVIEDAAGELSNDPWVSLRAFTEGS